MRKLPQRVIALLAVMENVRHSLDKLTLQRAREGVAKFQSQVQAAQDKLAKYGDQEYAVDGISEEIDTIAEETARYASSIAGAEEMAQRYFADIEAVRFPVTLSK